MSSFPHDEQAQGGSLPEKLNSDMDRRTFFSWSALLGLGFAAGCSGVGRDWNGVVAGPSMLEAVPDGNARALDIFNASPDARELGAWLQRFGLRQEPGRALLFDVPEVTATSGIKAEDRPSLIGESAYKTFQNDSFAQSRLTADQMASLATVGRVDMASEIGSLIQHGGAVLAAACCCCCCCCATCCSCCGTTHHHHYASARYYATAVPFGDPSVELAGEVRSYFRGTVGVQENGDAVAILEAVSNDPAMTVREVTIGAIDRATRAVRTYRFTPQELDDLGPQALADRLFAAA